MKKIWISFILFLSIFCSCHRNSPPVIRWIIADPARILPDSSTLLYADVDDAELDSLIYHWSSTFRLLSDSFSATTYWKAPHDSGLYRIMLSVTDPSGASDTDSVWITVSENTPGQPVVSYDILDQGGIVRLSWGHVPNAQGYNIYADTTMIASTTDTYYDAAQPARYYSVSAYAFNSESRRDSIDFRPVVTDSVLVIGIRDTLLASGVGFDSNGIAISLLLNNSANWSKLDCYFDDYHYSPIAFISPADHVPPFNNKCSLIRKDSGSDFDLMTIASPPEYYLTQYLLGYALYSIWLDPDDDGWDNTNDHFIKMKVISIFDGIGKQAYVKFAYQPIHGLRWLVTK